MSSIFGIVSKTQAAPDSAPLAAMHAVLPNPFSDVESAHQDNKASLMLRHARRPLLTNESGAITLACIGAIPNYRDLREELLSLGHTFATPHDAETIVHLYEEQGDNLFSSLKGPFCVALWDASAQRLILATDPMAQKPIYYYEDDHILMFASAIPPLLAHPSVPCKSVLIDSSTLAENLHTGQLAGRTTGFQGIRVLYAGEQLVWEGGASTRARYWAIPALTPAEPEATIVDHEDRLREKLAESVRLHLTDESVGVLLSGGISSSLVAAMMQQQNRVLQTFTIRFGKDTPEVTRAAEVAKHLGAKHTVIPLKSPDLSELLPRLVQETAQPLLAPHDVLIGLLSAAVEGKIKVALLGTGGLPLLGDPMPAAKPRPRLRRMWQAASTFLQRARAARLREEAASADSLALFSPSEVEALIDETPPFPFAPPAPLSRAMFIMHTRFMHHLAPIYHISGGSGIEAQVPFADAAMIEAAALVPMNLRQRPGQPLYVLHESARGLLPSAFLKSPVAREYLPLDRWMREQPEFAREILLGKRALARNILNKQAVYGLIDAHMQGHDASAELLALLSLEIWHRLFIDESQRV